MLISLTEEMLREAVIKADMYEMEALPEDDEIEHEFSAEFENKMQKLIRKSKKAAVKGIGRLWGSRVVVIAAILIILFASAMSVSAVRAKVYELITEVYEKFTHIFLESSRSSQDSLDSSQDADCGFTVYEPGYIPEGFELINRITDGLVLLEYQRGDDFISYTQQRIESVSMHINTEGIEVERFEFKGLPAMYYSNQGVQNLLWYDETYMYMVSSTLDKDAVFEIAGSVKVKE
ncbi:MAG: hypothetical protein PWQ96_2473 [Clostridia bacterium]|nr:hypothetical protein [Clostridia bacterium]